MIVAITTLFLRENASFSAGHYVRGAAGGNRSSRCQPTRRKLPDG